MSKPQTTCAGPLAHCEEYEILYEQYQALRDLILKAPPGRDAFIEVMKMYCTDRYQACMQHGAMHIKRSR